MRSTTPARTGRTAFQPARQELVTEPQFKIRWVGEVQL